MGHLRAAALGLSPVADIVGCTAIDGPILPAMLLKCHEGASLLPVWRLYRARLATFGVFAPLSYIVVLTAITIAPVALVAPGREVSVVLVRMFGALVLREAGRTGRLCGSVLVVCGILLPAW